MLPKVLRLKKRDEIDKVFKNGLHLKSDHFFYKYTYSENLKFCITVAKKLKLNKPQKNKLKRQISHIIRESLSSARLKNNFNFNIVLVLHTIPKDKDYFKILKSEVSNFINQLQNEQ